MQHSHRLSRSSGSQQTSLLPSFGAAPRELCLCPLTYGHRATACTLVPRGHFPSLLAQIEFPSCSYQQTGRGLNGKGAGSARGTGRTDPGVCWFLVLDSKDECDGDARWRFSATCRAPDAPEVTNLPSSAGASRFTKAYAEFTHVCQGSLTFPRDIYCSPQRVFDTDTFLPYLRASGNVGLLTLGLVNCSSSCQHLCSCDNDECRS